MLTILIDIDLFELSQYLLHDNNDINNNTVCIFNKQEYVLPEVLETSAIYYVVDF